MAKEAKKAAAEKSSERLYKEEKFKVREGLGNVAGMAEKRQTKTHLKKLDEYVKKTSSRTTIEKRESAASRAKIAEWSERYGNIDQKGVDKYLCDPALSNSFFWKTETTKDSLSQAPILEIKDDNRVYFLNGNVHGQRVFTLDQFEDVVEGRKIECCPGIDYCQIEQESTEIEYGHDCQYAQQLCTTHSNVCHQVPGTPENQIQIAQIPGVIVSPVTIENGMCIGQCTTGCFENVPFSLPQNEFEGFLVDVQGHVDCGIDMTQTCPIELGSMEYNQNALGYDEFCETECGEDCDLLGNHTVECDTNIIAEGIGEENLFLDDIDDETLESLEKKLIALKRQKRMNARHLGPGEKTALAAILGGGAIGIANGSMPAALGANLATIGSAAGSIAQATGSISLSSLSSVAGISTAANSIVASGAALTAGAIAWPLLLAGAGVLVVSKVIKKIREVVARRRAEREKLGLTKKEYREFCKNRRKENRALKKEEKQQYIEEYSRRLWRKKKRTGRRVARSESKIKYHEAKQGVKETRKKIRKAKKARRKGETVNVSDESLSKKEARKQKRADRKAQKGKEV